MPIQTTFTIAQLSDLHLVGNVGTDNSYHKFNACLAAAMNYHPDFLLLTGDLVNDGNTAGYDWLFDKLTQSKLPFACLAGNHDVTHEHNSHLPFCQRHFSAVMADSRLSASKRYVFGNWQLLCLDSTLPAKTHGHLSRDSLVWLDDMLNLHQISTIIALHHHPLPVLSTWIDLYMLDNADDFWQIIQRHRHARAVICGHVHQAHTFNPTQHRHAILYTSPAISRQFRPLADEFVLDNQTSGFRLLTLSDSINSQVIRMPPIIK